MTAHYEGWGEHHAYRCGKDDGFTDGYFAAVEACIAAVEALIEESPMRERAPLHDAIDTLREVQP